MNNEQLTVPQIQLTNATVLLMNRKNIYFGVSKSNNFIGLRWYIRSILFRTRNKDAENKRFDITKTKIYSSFLRYS